MSGRRGCSGAGAGASGGDLPDQLVDCRGDRQRVGRADHRFLKMQPRVEQGVEIVGRGGRGRGELLDQRLRPGPHRADLDRNRAAADRRAKPQELPAPQIADLLGLAALHPQQIGGAGHVDIEEGAPHQEVGGFGRDILGQLGEALGGDHARQPALAPPAHQIGHGRQAQPPGLVADLAGHGRGKDLRLVHHHQRRIPLLTRGIEQGG